MSHEQSADPVEHASPVDFAATLARLLKAIEQSGMTLFTTIDHAAGARDAGLAMPPTLVLIYGNPKGGTPMMLEAPLMALDLPLRVLLRQDAMDVLRSRSTRSSRCYGTPVCPMRWQTG